MTPETRRILALLDALVRVEAFADEYETALRGPSDAEGQA